MQSDLPPNLLLGMGEAARRRIFASESSGQARVNQLFREVQRRIVDRQTVLTVAQQADAPKRVRDARRVLGKEGILILGHERHHREIATALDLPVSGKGEWVAVRVRPVETGDWRPCFITDQGRWAIAVDDDPVAVAPEC